MSPPLIRLPGYEVPQNALMNFAPINNAIDSYEQRQERDRQYGMQRERFGMEKQRFAADRENEIKRRIGNLALLTLQKPEAEREASWKSVLALHPEAAKLGPQYGDFRTGPLALLADAGMAGDYLTYQMRQQEAARAAAADRRAAELHPEQLTGARLQNQARQAELDAPKTAKVELKPGETSILYDPRTGQQRASFSGGPKPPDATDRKATWEAQDALPGIKTTIEQLEEASGLVEKAYHGYMSQTRSAHNQSAWSRLPNVISTPDASAATVRLNQLMSEQAIAAMSAALKGATTDREMDAFKALMANPGAAPQQKLAAINDLLTRAKRQQVVTMQRLQELGGKAPDFTRGPSDGAPSGAAAGNDPLGIRR